MKKLLLILPILFTINCTGPTEKKATKKVTKKENVFLLNGKTKCEIYLETEYYSRIKTDTFVKESDLVLIVDSLNPKNKLVYFNIPELLGKGEEYAALTYGLAGVYGDFNKEKLLKEKSENRKAEIERIKKAGRRDNDFAGKAFIMSQDFVKEKLTSPKSADFPFNDYKSSNVIDNTIVIESYVDAKNAYGTEIRHNYSIKIKKVGSDWSDRNSWKVESLNFD